MPTPIIRSYDFGYQAIEGAMSTSDMSQTSDGRARRVDARANRSRILDVAEEVFGKGGESASTEEVARLAGVGIATVFRHFPTKAALLQAVLVRRFDRLREQAEALLDTTDPGSAFFDFFRHLVADAATKIAISEALLDAGGDSDGDAIHASNGLRRAVGALLQHAQQAGAVRDDVELPEVYALLVATSRAAAHADLDEEVKARALVIVFDGLAPHPTARVQTHRPEPSQLDGRAST
ncbi:TetR/AcrR family transcriptional regulator [Micromonospora taraxaci]|uniref:TetR/AcrR family transcriptional regulator n=1 Tax=Micromonospora taraxaci TaxID=1316803 RepID=UPI0033F4FB0E